MLAIQLAYRQLLSLLRAGELTILLAALILSVAATTTVSLFTDRIHSSLLTQGNILLGADIVVTADHKIPKLFLDQAKKSHLPAIEAMEFASMVIKADKNQLAEIKAVEQGFPLRGDLSISQQLHGSGVVTHSIPASGEVWIEPRLANSLAVVVGDDLQLGDRQFKVAAILQRETSRGGDMFSIAPRLMMNLADVQSTGLIQFGSRVNYQLMVAANLEQTKAYAEWLKPLIARGEKIQDISNARPEMRTALDKSSQFLGLAALVGVMLSMAAIYLASMPYLQKSLDSYALLRCFGASSRTITTMMCYQILMLGFAASLIGCVLAYVGQAILASLAGKLILQSLPAPSLMPMIGGLMTGLLVLVAAILPALLKLRSVPALRVLRQDVGLTHGRRYLEFVPALLVVVLLIVWQAQDIKLAMYTLLSLLLLFLLISALYGIANILLQKFLGGDFRVWKFGLSNLRRRGLLSLIQVLGFSVGLAAIMLLAIVRSDLMQSWQKSLPMDAPNRFVINIQPNQIKPILGFFHDANLPQPQIFPMVKGRLIAVNRQVVNPDSYADDRARRLADREFNLSWAAEMQTDNQITAGRWWQQNEAGKPMLSLEQGIAETLNIKLGDTLTYDIAGQQIELKVSSLRKVEWDSMKANFFVVTPPGVLENYPASYITSFYLASGNESVLNRLLQQFPNLTVIDVASLMQQVKAVMDKMVAAVGFVFIFTLLAGFAIFFAALQAGRDERLKEAALMRVFGASNRQIRLYVISEFALIGLLASIVASFIANITAYTISTNLMGIPYYFNALSMLQLVLLTPILISLTAWMAVRHSINTPPKILINNT